MFNHKNNCILIKVTILLTLFTVILNRKSFPSTQSASIYTIYSEIVNSLQNQNVFDLFHTITTPSFNITILQVKPMFLFPNNYTFNNVSQSVIELCNQTVSFFFNVSLTSLKVKHNHKQYASLMFKSLHASQKYVNIIFIRKPDNSFYAEIYPNYNEFRIQLPYELQYMSKYNEINTYLTNNAKNISEFFIKVVNVSLTRTLNLYPASDSEYYFDINCDYIIKLDYFNMFYYTALGVVTKVKITSIKYEDKERKGKGEGYVVFKNVEFNIVYLEDIGGVEYEKKGRMMIHKLTYGANIFDEYGIHCDLPLLLPLEIINRFQRIYECLLIEK